MDQIKNPDERVGLMHCYCMQSLKKNPSKIAQIL